MDNKSLKILYMELESEIGKLYEKYKLQFDTAERGECEEYLYTQGEYELAIDALLSILKHKNITLENSESTTVDRIYSLMKIPRPDSTF